MQDKKMELDLRAGFAGLTGSFRRDFSFDNGTFEGQPEISPQMIPSTPIAFVTNLETGQSSFVFTGSAAAGMGVGGEANFDLRINLPAKKPAQVDFTEAEKLMQDIRKEE